LRGVDGSSAVTVKAARTALARATTLNVRAACAKRVAVFLRSVSLHDAG
jgi:hypothetical protein